MKTSDNGRKLIEQFEGLILSAYDDYNDHVVPAGGSCRGTLTIGYGHTSAAGQPHVFIGQTITRAEADQILASDLSAVEHEIDTLVKVPLNQNQFDALVSFQFNTGALGHSTALKVLNQSDYADVPKYLGLYTHANGQELAGLARRRQAENSLFTTAPKLTPPVLLPTPSVPAPTVPIVKTQNWFAIVLNFLLSLIKGK